MNLIEICSIWDYFFYDEATQTNHRNDWSDDYGAISVSYSSDGTTMTEPNGTTKTYIANFSAITDPVIEFDLQGIVIPSNNQRFVYKGADIYFGNRLSDLQWHHFKVICTNGECSMYIDNELLNTKTTTTSTTCAFRINGASYKFKNFKIYKL